MTKDLNIRLVQESASWWSLAIYVGNRRKANLMTGGSQYKSNAIRSAKRLSKATGIKYNPVIIKNC
jgi:hypothetical protein